MITISIEGIDYTIKQSLSEFTIGEYEKITEILALNDLDKIEKYAKLFVYLGIPNEIIDDLDFSTFIKIVEDYVKNNDLDIETLTPSYAQEIEINGRVYKSFEGENFKMTVKQMKFIEKAVKTNPIAYIGEMMSIIFKDIELTDNEHYVDAHLKHKAKLFREHVTVDKAIPYISYFSKELLSNLTTYSNL